MLISDSKILKESFDLWVKKVVQAIVLCIELENLDGYGAEGYIKSKFVEFYVASSC
jgi:hypothetical protein